MKESPDLLRVADVAAELRVSRSRVYQLLRACELPVVRVGGALRIPQAAWRKWLDEQRDRALQAVRRPED